MTFREFWPQYLQAHWQSPTRAAHYAATIVAFAGIGAAIYLRVPLIALGGIAASYAIALASHRFLEDNRSLVFVNPAWGALADLKMCWMMLTGSLAAELARHAAIRNTSQHFLPHGDSLRRVAAARHQP